MDYIKIMQGLVIILIFSLACASIYAAEIEEVCDDDFSNDEGYINISESDNDSNVMGLASQIHDVNHMSIQSLHI